MSIPTNASISQSYRSLAAIRARHIAERKAASARNDRNDLVLACLCIAAGAGVCLFHVIF